MFYLAFLTTPQTQIETVRSCCWITEVLEWLMANLQLYGIFYGTLQQQKKNFTCKLCQFSSQSVSHLNELFLLLRQLAYASCRFL